MKKLLYLISLSLIFFSCKKTDFQGMEVFALEQNINDIDIQLVNPTPNFQNGDKVYFSGVFNQMTSVKIQIIGLESGAYKNFSINTIELNELNSTWTGGSSSITGFQNEKCEVIISFYGTDHIIKKNLEIRGITDYQNSYTVNLGSNGFEQPSSSQLFNTKHGYIVSNENPLQGSFSLEAPFDNNTKYSYIGEDNLGPNNFYPLPSDPKRVWFNIYVFGIGDPDSKFFIEFKEADNDHIQYQNGRDDGVQAFIDLGHNGWKLFSFRYSDLGFSNVTAFGGSGKKIHEPHKIQMTTYNFEGSGNSGKFYFDLPIYTVDQPFDPNNY